MAEKTIPVRTILMPAYYKAFHCIMGKCQDNCCDDGWRIEFSKKDYLAIKRAPKSPELQARMEEGMFRLRNHAQNGMYAELRVTPEGRCCFHREDGLCTLQMECGAEVLPEVCRQFPRYDDYTAAAKEYSLSLACEGVLALLWDLPQGVDFIEESLHPSEVKYVRLHNSAQEQFPAIRALCIDVLQERSLGLSQRMLLLGLLLQQLGEADWESGEAVDRWLLRGAALLHDPAIPAELDKLPQNRRMCLLSNYKAMVLAGIGVKNGGLAGELRTSIFSAPPDRPEEVTVHLDHYRALEEKLEELLGHSEYFFENLMVSLAFQWGVPELSDPETMWKNYVNLCNIYSFFRFAAVCAMEREASRERLFHVLVTAARALLHNKSRQVMLRDDFFDNDSATLAHMAILLGG